MTSDSNDNYINNLIQLYNADPTAEKYFNVLNLYNEGKYSNEEMGIRVYLFLLGANIQKHYTPISKDEHSEYIKYIRNAVENGGGINGTARKAYYDLGFRAGYYK